MIRDNRGAALREIGTLFRVGTFAGVSDGALLERFVGGHGEGAEAAFAALVDRHGPMVLRVCQHELKDTNDAEDAFQATFLALLRGAHSIRNWDSVASWLHGTALRVAACSRASQARRRIHEGRSVELRVFSKNEYACEHSKAIIHQEVDRLPDRYRVAIVLCDLEGLSHQEASQQLGWPIGTLKSRIFRGRERLKIRLGRRGLAPGAGLVGLMAGEAQASVGLKLVEATVRLAMGQRMAGVVAPAVRLADLFQRGLIMSRFRWMAAGVATFSMLAAGATLLAQQGSGDGAVSLYSRLGEVTGPYKVIYSVSNLVKGAPEDPDGHWPPVEMNPLIELITSTVAPGTWKDRDSKGHLTAGSTGVGTIGQHGTSLSLIIVQTAEVHALIVERLEQLGHLVSARENGVARAKLTGVETVDSFARRLYDEGTKAYQAADFARAVTLFEDAANPWQRRLKVTNGDPGATINKNDYNLMLKRYVRAYRQLGKPIPKDSPFAELADSSSDDSQVDPFKSTEKPGSGSQATQPPSGPGSAGGMMSMMAGGMSGMMGSGKMSGPGSPGSMPGMAGMSGMSGMAGMSGMMGSGKMSGPGTPGSMSGMASMMRGGSKITSPAFGGSSGMAAGSPGGAEAKPITDPTAPTQSMGMHMPGPIDKTEQRLRAVEDKLDRLIKLLDAPKSDGVRR